jgi:asparagine synthase (glutamine-hydrolysing)
MLLCEHSRNHSKVILTGEGSDELFGGYRSFKNYNIMKYRVLNFLKRHNIIVGLIPDISALRTLKNSIRNIHLGIDQSAFFSREKSQLVFNDLNEKIEFRKSAVENVDHLVNKIFASFQTSYLNYLFERQDKMSMAMSVEARVPFSNHLLFNELNKISFKKKIKPVPKAILKKLSEEYYGKSFIYRKKIGFDLPLDDWLRDKNQLQPMLALLTDKTFKERGFYNHKKINSLINNHLAGKENNSNFLINMIDFEVWHRLFIDKYN